MERAIKTLNTLKNLAVKSDIVLDNYSKAIDSSFVDFMLSNEYYSSVYKMLETIIEFEFEMSTELVLDWLFDERSAYYNLPAEKFVLILDEDWRKK